MTGPRPTGGPVFIHTSGDPDPLNLDQRERRYIAVDTATEELCREQQVKLEYGEGARVVAPYKPNRKQRRAQEKARELQAKSLKEKK